MKRLLCFVCLLAFLLTTAGGLTTSAAGSVTVSTSKNTVTVGSTVTVTAKCNGGGKGIGSLDAYFRYNAKTFEYVSCDGAVANGGAGAIKMSYFAEGLEGPKTLTVTLTLKAIAVGSGDFQWETEGMYDDEDNLLSSTDKSLSVSANNPTLSGDATLSYLRPSKGTLTPKFDKDVTEYTVSVPYTVTRGLLNYTATDPDATTDITDNADLKVGKNTRVITVTAPNGTIRKYTVVITREAQQGTTTPSGNATTPSANTPDKDALTVNVNGKELQIADTRPSAQLPENYSWDTTEINHIEVPAAKQAASGLLLLYLTEPDNSKIGAFYLYDATEDSFLPFHQLKGTSAAYTVHNLPNTETGPVGTVPGLFTVGEDTVTAYVYEAPELADYVILCLTAPSGETGLYTYDKSAGSIQRYYRQPTEENHTVTTPDPPEDDKQPKAPGAFASFIKEHKSVILTIAAACCGLALLIAAVVFAVRLIPGSQKGKH